VEGLLKRIIGYAAAAGSTEIFKSVADVAGVLKGAASPATATFADVKTY
jgi:hypothetical protein